MMNDNAPLTAQKTREVKLQITNGFCKQSWKTDTQYFIYINKMQNFSFQILCFSLSPTFSGPICHFRQPV